MNGARVDATGAGPDKPRGGGRSLRVLLIDNYDSFTFNLVHALGDHAVEVRRNDALDAAWALDFAPDALVVSPGPCTPGEAGASVEVIRALGATTPTFGVCLGFQAIAVAHGGRVVRAPHPMHGKTSPVQHDGSALYEGLPNPYTAARYHSLVVERETLPAALVPTAWTHDGIVMGVRHVAHPVHGVLFHPESVATPQGGRLVANFLALAGAHRAGVLSRAA